MLNKMQLISNINHETEKQYINPTAKTNKFLKYISI
jgi:hypothetical protein